MKTTNTSILAAKAEKKKVTFSTAITSSSLQNMISSTLKNPRRAASFTSTLISVVGSNEKLQQCEPGSIVAAALRGEGMDLSLALGQFSIVPYGDRANYQISYKGLSQLAMRSGMYADFDAFDVREGEYMGKNPRTRQPIIEWIDDEDEREKKPLAGIYAFYELKTGFFKSMYWSHEKILNHADRYSQAFNKATYEKLLAGELEPREVDKLKNGSPWYGEPLSEQHLTMCKKTLLLRLLGDGKAPLSIEMRMAIDNESAQEKAGAVIFPEDPAVVEANASTAKQEESEVVIESTATEKPVEEPEPESASKRTRSASEPQKRQGATTGRASAKNAQKGPETPRESDMPLEAYMNIPEDIGEPNFG